MRAPERVLPLRSAPLKLHSRKSSSLSDTPFACPMVLPMKPFSQRPAYSCRGGNLKLGVAAMLEPGTMIRYSSYSRLHGLPRRPYPRWLHELFGQWWLCEVPSLCRLHVLQGHGSAGILDRHLLPTATLDAWHWAQDHH